MKEHKLLKELYDNIALYYQWLSAEQQAILDNADDYIFDNIYERQAYFNGIANMIYKEYLEEFNEDIDLDI